MRAVVTTVAFVLVISIIYAAAATRAETVVVTAADCAALAQHVPDADVSYKPGTDADGKPVAPADLGGGIRIETPATFEIPITVDLRQKLGIPPDPTQFQTDQFTVGTVTYRDGQAFFNGQPLQDEESARLSELCQRQLRAAH